MVATVLGIAAVVLGSYLVLFILLGQVDAISAAWPRYVARIETIVSDQMQWLGPERSAKLRNVVAEIDLARRVPAVMASAQSFVVTILLVIAYVGFLFAESGHMTNKISAMSADERRARDTNAMLTAVSSSVRRYVWIKSVISILTAAACYAVLRWLGIDFAETWALLIFLLITSPTSAQS